MLGADYVSTDVLIQMRQHPVVLLRAVLVNVAALTVLIGISHVLETYGFLYFYSIPFVILLLELIIWYGRRFVVTASQVIKEEALFPSHSDYISLKYLKNVVYRQSILGKVLGYGNVRLEAIGRKETVVFYFIPGPAEFSRYVLQQRKLYGVSSEHHQDRAV